MTRATPPPAQPVHVEARLAARPAQPALATRPDTATASVAAGPVDPFGGLRLTRTLLGASLMPAQDWVAAITELQVHQGEALKAWGDNLDQALREAETAADMTALLAVPAQFINRQLALTMQLLGSGTSRLLAGEATLAERVRSEALELWRQALPEDAGDSAAPAEGVDRLLLQQMGNLQDQWLAQTQRWIDSVNQSTRH